MERESHKTERTEFEKQIKEQAEQLLISAQGQNKLDQTQQQLAAAKARHEEIIKSKEENLHSLQQQIEVRISQQD